MSVSRNKHFQSFTVGKLDAGMILIGERAHLIEFPSLLLPAGTVSGSIVSISVLRDHAAERSHASAFSTLQNDILEAYGTRAPSAPVLSLLNTTQTSVTLEWGKLDLASATLRSVEIYRNGTRLAGIPNPSHNTSTKLSSLQLDTDYTFQLVMKTTAGTFPSNVIRVRTHTMNDTSGISVCFGNVQDPKLLHQAQVALDQMGARYSDKIQIDTTHFVCTTPAGLTGSGPSVEYQKALQLTLPVVEPGWIFACLQEKKMVPISQHLLGSNSTYNPINNASFTRLPSGSDPTSPRNLAEGAGIQRQPSPETRARSSIPEDDDSNSVAPDTDARPVFERPPSVTGGKLNRGYKFPLSTEALALQKEEEEAAAAKQAEAASTPNIAEPAVILESESDAETTAAPSFQRDAPDVDATPTAPSGEFEVVEVNDAPETVVVAAPPTEEESASAPDVTVDAPEQRPRPSVPELIFSPPPEEQSVPSFPVERAAELKAASPAEVEPTPEKAVAEEQIAEELAEPGREPQAISPPADEAPVTPAAELEADMPTEQPTESEPTQAETLEEAKLADDLVEPIPEAVAAAEDDPSAEGTASADVSDDEAAVGQSKPGDGAAAAGDGEKAKKSKSKKKKKSKSVAK